MPFKSLLLSFRLSEYLFSVLLVAVLTALSMYYYRPYVLNAFMVNQFYALMGVRIQLAIDNAYTGLPQGSKVLGDYQGLIDEDSTNATDMIVSENGHISLEVKMPSNGYYGGALLSNIAGQRVSLYRTVNDQGAYVFHSWQCNPKGNELPYLVTQSETKPINVNPMFGIYCREKKL